MSWIGKAGADPRVVMVAAQTPFKTLADLRDSKSEVLFAVGGAGGAAFVETMVLINALKLPARRLAGYVASDDQMASAAARFTRPSGRASTYEEFVKNGFGRYIVQIGGTEADVPQLGDMVSDPTSTALLSLIRSQGEVARLTAGPPGIPADRLDALRAAFLDALNDEELKARAAKLLGRPVEPAGGDEVSKLVKAALDQTPETINLIKEGMRTVSARQPSLAAPMTMPLSRMNTGTITLHLGSVIIRLVPTRTFGGPRAHRPRRPRI